jgi:hypothetical protein
MPCPLCQQRKARRQCPALGQTICPVCCGTKRLTEIDCPSHCVHLVASREHPAAVVKRQQAHDAALIAPSIRDLTERQLQLFFLLHTAIARHVPDGFARLVDDDVAEAADALAATLETAARGVLYEHTPASLPAQRLAADIRAMFEEMRKEGVRLYDHETAVVLRAVERGARDTRRVEPGETAYLSLMARLLQVSRAASAADRPEASGPSIIVP